MDRGRTFGWLIQLRQFIRDHEVKIDDSEDMIYLSMTKPMLDRISRGICSIQSLSNFYASSISTTGFRLIDDVEALEVSDQVFPVKIG